MLSLEFLHEKSADTLVVTPPFYFAVPLAVTGLQVEPILSTCSLQLSWQEALGISDGYILQVLDERGGIVANGSQPVGFTRYTFDGLTPGKKYRILVQTTSGGLHSLGVGAEARTRKTFCFYSDVQE